MIPEIGLYALTLALCFSFFQMTLPLYGALKSDQFLMRLSVPFTTIVFLLLAFSFALLVTTFLRNDFSVLYASNHSNTLLPWYYRVSAVWGAHEGSMLLWVLVLASWSFAVAMLSNNLPNELRSILLAVQGALMVGFLLFIVLTSNPFERTFPNLPVEGADLNPTLQDIGLIIHPPMLYMGYVGFSVAFSFAISALILGRLDANLARWMRPWTNVAWAFLTCGILLGSWWAYYELGWGGFWFWDPVENSSLMPWLVGTALIHSLAVSEKRDMFKRWTILLSISAFSFSLLGAFLVRSGVLNSVHSFASDPTRGLFILMFLATVIGGSLYLYAVRLQNMKPSGGFETVSRETGLLVNNLLFGMMAAVVLAGTLYPIIIEMLDLGSVSVGPPFFNLFAALIFTPMLLLLAPGQNLRWKRDNMQQILARMIMPAAVSVIGAIVLSFVLAGRFEPLIVVGALVALWIIVHQVQDVRFQIRNASSLRQGLMRLSPTYWGMQLAHFGVAVLVAGLLFTVTLSIEAHVKIEPGEDHVLGGFTFRADEFRVVDGPNYKADEGVFTVLKDGKEIEKVYPQKRRYLSSQQPLTEAGIVGNIWREIYITLGEPLGEGAWSVRLYVKPFIRMIWYGPLLMALGGILAVFDKRYRKKSPSAMANEKAVAGAAAQPLEAGA